MQFTKKTYIYIYLTVNKSSPLEHISGVTVFRQVCE